MEETPKQNIAIGPTPEEVIPSVLPPPATTSSIAESLEPSIPPQEKIRIETPPAPPEKGGGVKRIFLAGLAVVILLVLGVAIVKFLPKLRLKPVTLTYWGLWETEQVMAPVIADFEKTHSKIKINYVRQSPKQYRERLASSLARGEGPDVFRFHNTWLPMFSRDLAPVPGKIASELNFSQNFYPVVSQDLKRGNDYFGIPLEIDGLGLFVNEEIFRAAGLTYPTTWDELRISACKLTAKNGDQIVTAGVALGTTSNVEHWSDILGLMMLQNGADLTNPTGKLAEDALNFYTVFETDKACDPSSRVWDETLDNSILAFAKGQVAMIFAPSWEAFEIKNINPNLAFKIIPVPQLPGANISWASYWVEGVWQKSKYQAEAFEFLKYLASKEAMTKLFSEEAKVRLFGEPYSRIDLGQALTTDPYAGAFIEQAPNARSFYLCSRTHDNGINDKIIKYFEDAVNSLDKGVSPTAALETAAKGVQQVLATYGVISSPPAGGSAR